MDDETLRKELKPIPDSEYVKSIVSKYWNLQVTSCDQLESYDGKYLSNYNNK